MNQKKTSSILRKFLLFNLLVFSILGLFTFIYLKAIQPNLVNIKSKNHLIVIKNTTDHLQRLKIDFNEKGLSSFLLSARFLFQSLDRVQFFNLNGNLIGDTDMLDIDQNVFSKSEAIIEQEINNSSIINKSSLENNKINDSLKYYKKVKDIILNELKNDPLIIENKKKNDFFVRTLSNVLIKERVVGYILVSEQANEIIVAVKERKNFIIRTVLAVALVILIFSVFLNKYILKPISFLVGYTESIKTKSSTTVKIDKFLIRKDEVGTLTRSIHEMTLDLQKRTNRAETFSTDLAHEIRNPLASLKGASELLDKTIEQTDREKLLNIINHDVERIERLITDYSQMLKDEASLSREKMFKIDLNKYTTHRNYIITFPTRTLYNTTPTMITPTIRNNSKNENALLLLLPPDKLSDPAHRPPSLHGAPYVFSFATGSGSGLGSGLGRGTNVISVSHTVGFKELSPSMTIDKTPDDTNFAAAIV